MIKRLLVLTIILSFSIPSIIYAEESNTDNIMYTTTRVNFRNSPEIKEDNIIEVLTRKTSIKIIENRKYNEEWLLCEYENQEGYIHSDYVTDDEPFAPDYEYLGNYKITGYRMFAASENGGRSDGVTASGVVGEPGRTVAMKDLAFGTRIYIDGLGEYVVEDRGVGSGVVDVACYTTDECYLITGYYDVYLVED